MNLVDQRLQAIRKLLLVHIPVAQPRVVVFALPKPPIVHHEPVQSQRRCLLSERHLSGFIHSELRRFPGVVNHRPKFRRQCLGRRSCCLPSRHTPLRQYVLQLKVVQQPRRSTQTMRRVSAVENRRLQRYPGLQHISKIKRIEPARHPHRVQLIPFHRNPPRPAPRERPKPHLAVIFICLARLQRKPRIRLVPRRSSPAFDHPCSRMNSFLVQRPLSGPAPGQVIQRVLPCRQCPSCGGGLLHSRRQRSPVFNRCPTRQNPASRIHRVVQRHKNRARNILQHHIEPIRRCSVALVVQHQVANPVDKCYLQRRLNKQPATPTRILLWGSRVRRIERRPLLLRHGHRKCIRRPQPPTPIDLLQLSARIHAEHIRTPAPTQPKYLGGRIETLQRGLRKRNN